MTEQQSQARSLHSRRMELLVAKDNLENEISIRQDNLKLVETELGMLRNMIQGADMANQDFQTQEALRKAAERADAGAKKQ